MCGRTACYFADSPSVNILCKSLDKSKKCAIIKVRGNTGDGCYLPLTEITANFRGAGGYFFLLNDRMTKIVVINDNTTPENCISCSKVM